MNRSNYLPAPAIGGPAIHRVSPLLGTVAQWGAAIVLGLVVILALSSGHKWSTSLPQTVNLDAQQAGSNVSLQVGDTLQITLEGNPSAGYSWSTAGLDTSILQASGEPAFQPAGSALGAGGTITSRFLAAGQGQTTLKMIYSRPFESDVAPLKTFVANVVVNSPPPVPGSYP